MADDIDFEKCVEFDGGHFGIPHDPSASTNLIKIGKNYAWMVKLLFIGKSQKLYKISDDIDFQKCAEFYGGRFGIVHDPSTCTNLIQIG